MNSFNMGGGVNFDISTPEGMENAVAWTDRLFASIVDGGRWIVPRSMSIYEINHTTKTVRRIMGAFEEPVIERVVKAAGWKYEDKSVMT
jgi:hypothetical protein